MRRDICWSIRQVHRSTRISKGARSEIAVDSDNCVHLNQTTDLLIKNKTQTAVINIGNTAVINVGSEKLMLY